MTHANAPLTPLDRRRLAELVVLHGWPVRRASERFQVAPATAAKWAARSRAWQPMTDVSSRPRTTPARTPARAGAADHQPCG
jgi:transposase